MANLVCKKCQAPLFLEKCIKCSPDKIPVENGKFKFCKDYRDSIIINDTWNGAFAGYFCITIFLWAALFLRIFVSGGNLVSNSIIIIFSFWLISILIFGFAPLIIKQRIISFVYNYVFKLFRPPIIESPPILQYDTIFAEKVYILSHPSMPGILKIERTKQGVIEKLIYIFTPFVNSIFEMEATISTPDCCELEKLLNLFFDDYRINGRREFFRIDKNIVITKAKELNEVLISKHYINYNKIK